MQKNLLYVIILWAVSYSLVGCSEIDPEKFSDAPGVNFMSKGTSGWSDGVDGLKIAYNFGVNFEEWNAPQDTVILQVKLEGLTSVQPLKIRLKGEKVEKFRLADVVFADDYVFAPGENVAQLSVILKRPELTDTVYQNNIMVDYTASDVVAGTKERQKFLLEVKDELTLKMVQITEGDWAASMEWALGPYSKTRLRFVAYALQLTDFRMMGWYGPSQAQITKVREKLKEYNDTHTGNPILDDDGTPLEF